MRCKNTLLKVMYDTRRSFGVSTPQKIENLVEEIALCIGTGLMCVGRLFEMSWLFLKYSLTGFVLIIGAAMTLILTFLYCQSLFSLQWSGISGRDAATFISWALAMIIMFAVLVLEYRKWRKIRKTQNKEILQKEWEELKEETAILLRFIKWVGSRKR